MRTTTNRGLFSSGDFEQIGPMMETGRMWNVARIEEIAGNVSLGTVQRASSIGGTSSSSSITLTYYEDGGQHIAKVMRSERSGCFALYCDYCHRPQGGGRIQLDTRTTYCRHIRWMIKAGHDSAFISDVADPHMFLVPIAPSEGVYFPVWIERDANRGRYVISVPRSKVDSGPGDDDQYYQLGAVQYSEATASLMRLMLIDYFYGHLGDARFYYQASKTEAMAPSVQSAAEAIDNKLSAFTKRFAIGTTAMTFGEFEATTAPSPDAPDWN